MTHSLLFLPADQVSVGYGDKIGGLIMKMMVTKNICTYLRTVTEHCFSTKFKVLDKIDTSRPAPCWLACAHGISAGPRYASPFGDPPGTEN